MMADGVKSQKLAAARKKLKEFQQKAQKPIKKLPENEEGIVLSETLSSSTNSLVNGSGSVQSDGAHPESVTYEPSPIQTSPFHNYFQNKEQHSFTEQQNNFFDSLPTSCHNPYNILESTSNSNDVIAYTSYTKPYDDHNNESPNSDLPVISYNENKLVQEPVNNLSCYFGQVEGIEHPTVSSEDAKKLMEYMDNTNTDSSVKIFQENVENQNDQSVNSNSVTLQQQPSSQMPDIPLKDDEPHNSIQLENHNQKLTSFLRQEQMQPQVEYAQLQEYQNKIAQLEVEVQQLRSNHEHKLNDELRPLHEQLQSHGQTIEILVGEKTELTTALLQNQALAKQKVTECEELQGRLRASRSRVADLEKELQVLKLEKTKFERSDVHEEEIRRLKQENQDLSEQKEEAQQDLLELREKLNIKVNENLALQREIQDISHQFSLAQIKIEQITAGENLLSESQVEVLSQQKLALEKQVLELSQALKIAGNERDQASAQYQHYVQQLNGQLTSLASKLETVTSENASLSNREQDLVRHIGELEKHLQNIQKEGLHHVTRDENNSELKKELEAALESIQNLQLQKDELEENYKQILIDKGDLQQEVETKKKFVEELENQLEKLQSDQPDSSKLLAAMESDKVAAARAVAQNSELKQQLEEMQQAFVRMSNDKLELTEKLTSEQYLTKDLSEKLESTENQLHTLSDAIAIKDSELTHMRETLTYQNKQILQKDQLADRLRHYEAQDGSSQSLQIELQKAHEYIRQLVTENKKLKEELTNKRLVITAEQEREQEINNEDNKNESEVQETVSVVNNSVNNVENDEVIENVVTDLNILDKEAAMKRLEEKFTSTMLAIANLTEEKQRLEHIVTQLQGETETIGEYIALYQHQRGVLKQRTQEKDDQLKRLAQDREKVRSKLDLLNALVKKLVQEKGVVLTPEILEQHERLNNQSHELCTEHAKIQQEMNIGSKNVPSVENDEQLLHGNHNNNVNMDTAEKIITLLSEIKSSNLVQPSDGLENFHPCPWCSGQLITV